MSSKFYSNFVFFSMLFWGIGNSVFAQTSPPKSPQVFLLNAQILQSNKAKINDVALKPALAKLEKDAQKTLKLEILPITSKTANPPSGDRHDYMSQAPYFWKNPDTKDGFPYIRRDGERNPEIKQFPDHELLDKMTNAVETLSVAYYFTGKEEYAARASEISRRWFLDEKTKMNPNLQFAQAIPGVNSGRGIGIIETRELTRVIDSIGLLEGSKSWTKADQTGLETWFSKYLDWLTTSKNGRDEAAAKNNHGTIYDVQVISFALFVSKKDFAKTVLETAKQKRIAAQIEPDGKQPLELERTKSWNYSTMNLEGFMQLAELGENVGVDLWNFQTKDGRGIRQAIDFLFPFASEGKKWTYDQIEPLQPERLFAIMRRANRKFTDEKFEKIMSSVPKSANDDKNLLLY